MSKSAIYVANTTTQDVVENGQISLGTTVRRFGCNCHLLNNAINISGSGYYDVDAAFVVSSDTAGDVTITMYKDDVVIPGASATETLAADGTNQLSISCLVREYCPCGDSTSNLTFVVSGLDVTISNVGVVVEKI